MFRYRGWSCAGLGAIALIGLTGCQTAGLRLLSLVGLEHKPLVVALTLDARPASAAEALNPFPAYVALQKELGKDVGRPVSVDVCFPFQVKFGLDSGWYHIAVVSTTDYIRLSHEAEWRVLAAPVDEQDRVARSALLVVAATSPLSYASELRGQVVTFGRADDARCHYAALELLREAGLTATDLSLEALPIPGSLKHMPDGRSIAQTVINGSSVAGFMDEADYEALPEHPSAAGEPARDALRVIGRTMAVPSRLIIASPKLEPETVEQVQKSFLSMKRDHPEVLVPLNVAGYQVPNAELLARCRALPVGEVPNGGRPATESQPAPSQPAPTGTRR